MTHDSETYRFNLDKLDEIHDAVGEETDDDRLEQIDERVRIGTVRGAMDDRDFLAAEVQRLRAGLVEAWDRGYVSGHNVGSRAVRVVTNANLNPYRAALADQPARRTRIEGMSLG